MRSRALGACPHMSARSPRSNSKSSCKRPLRGQIARGLASRSPTQRVGRSVSYTHLRAHETSAHL
eukprot:12323096-Alexandrium_andersonii.AAC.1